MSHDDDSTDHETAILDEDSLLNVPEKARYAAKRTESDKAALLHDSSSSADDDGDMEYTDIFGTGTIVTSVPFEDGEELAVSDTEVHGYSGDTSSYVDEPSPLIAKKDMNLTKNLAEGILIDVNDSLNHVEKKEPYLKETNLNENETLQSNATVTNEKVSEIAGKLAEADANKERRGQQYPVSKPGKAVYLASSNDSFNPLRNSGFGEVSSDLSSDEGVHKKQDLEGYLGSSEQGEAYEILHIDPSDSKQDRKKKLRKKSGHADKDCTGRSKNGTVSHMNSTQDDNVEGIGPVSPNNNVHGQKENFVINQITRSSSSKKGHASDVHVDPQIQSAHKSKRHKKTRHRVYLDDPDIHQCIQDHAHLLRSYISDMKMGKQTMAKTAAVSNDTGKSYRYSRQIHSLPDVSVAGLDQGVIKQAKSVGHVAPYHGHDHRGRHLIAQVRGERESDSSTSVEEDDDEYTNRMMRPGQVKFKKGAKAGLQRSPVQTQTLYQKCPDCGEHHPVEDAQHGSQEICPDCGVPHNPYQHVPSGQDPDDSKFQDSLPSIEGPHTLDELTAGVRYKMKYLGSSQIMTQHPVTKETRMQQAQDAYSRIKGADDEESEPRTEVDMFISLERIKILNLETKFEDIMMDHALRTVCFICDMNDILVLMARKLTSDQLADVTMERGRAISLANIVAEKERKTSKNICHVFECVEAGKVAKAIGQAFNIAYRQFLNTNGISHEHVEEAEYCHVLESQKLVGEDLDKLTDSNAARDVVISKKRGEYLGIMLLESGWGSMLPTVFIAHIANYSPASLCQQLTVGDHILSCNGASLVGLPLSECNTTLRNARSSSRVVLKVVSCPPVVDVVLSRPDVKYQLGFSVQNGTICSLLRGGIAERGGIRVGHRIIEINGDSVVAKTHQHIVDVLAKTVGSISMKTMPVAMYRLMVGEDQPQHV